MKFEFLLNRGPANFFAVFDREIVVIAVLRITLLFLFLLFLLLGDKDEML